MRTMLTRSLTLCDPRLLSLMVALALAVVSFLGHGDPAAAGWSTSPGFR